MSKKILFMSSAKLTAICFSLLLAVFCTIGMSFTPGEEGENMGNPNDSTYVTGPRRSHYYESSSCGDTNHYVKDYAVAKATTIGNGTVSISSPSGGGVVTSPSSYTNGTVLTSESAANSSVSISWNCNHQETGTGQVTATAAMHKRKFTITANASPNYYFAGWSTSTSEDDIFEKSNPYTYEQFIDDWNQNNGSHESTGKALTTTYYAIFKPEVLATITFAVPENGSYTYSTEDVSATTVSSSTGQKTLKTKKAITLTATHASNYKFFGWYKGSDSPENYISYTTPLTTGFDEDATICAKFIPSNAAIFTIKNTDLLYPDLGQAIQAASSGSNKVIVPTINGTILSGNYTIPSGVTLLIPYDAGYTNPTSPAEVETWASLSEFRRLSLASGANITVNGAICVAGRQYGTSSGNPGPGSVLGAYGVLDMSAGGHITINNNANLYAYGFVIGKGDQSEAGTITIKSGGKVYENLVINDMHGGGGSAACVNGTTANNNYGLFPFNQYFIQNVEPKMTIEYGGLAYGYYDIVASGLGKHDKANIIGNSDSFLFQINSGGSVTKWYDVTRDYQCYEVNGSISMNEIAVYASSSIGLISSRFVLPITNNMDITVASGTTLALPYRIKLLPGAIMTIKEGAAVNVQNELYVYDYQDWDYYAMATDAYARTFGTTAAGKKFAWHTLRDVSAASKLGHAKLIIDGTLTLSSSGALYTTSHGGAINSNGTGKIVYSVAGKSTNTNLYECYGTYGKKSGGGALAQGETSAAAGQVQVGHYSYVKQYYIYGTPVECNPAQLHNSAAFKTTYGADFEYLATSGVAINTTINYKNGHWGWMEIWKDEDGTILKAINTTTQQSGTAPSNPTKECYTFAGWSTETVTANQEVIHTATYSDTPITYDIAYSAGAHGTGTVAGGTKTCGEDFTLSSSTFTRDEYVQTGWSTSDGGEKAYELGGPYTNNADITLYPFWTEAEASVTVEGEDPTYYTTVAKAITAANGMTNPIVKILKSATITSEISLNAAMTIDLNGKKISSTQTTANTAVFKINASGKTVTIKDSGTNGEINHTASTSGTNYLYGVNITGGSMSVVSGKIYAENTGSSRAYGINTATSATLVTVSGSAIIEAKSSSSFGIYTNNSCNLTMTGGTFTATGSTSRGIYVKGKTDLTDATITASGSGARAIFAVSGTMNIYSGTYTAIGANDNLCIFHRKNTITIHGGYFSATNKLYALDTGDASYTGTITLLGGYYNNGTELEEKCATNYHVLPNADANYPYKVAEAYTVTFNANGHGTAPASQLIVKGQKATEPAAPTADGYTFGGWYKEAGCTNAWNFASDVVNANTTLFAKWTMNEYTITWLNWDSSPLKDPTITSSNYYREIPSYPALGNPDPTRNPYNGKTYAWDGWTTEVNGAGTFYAIGESLPEVTANATYYAHFRITAIEVNTSDNIEIEENTNVETTIVHIQGALTVPTSTELSTNNLILEGTPNSSGEILGAGTVTATNAYFDLSHEGGFKARTWYAVAVPWQVAVPAYEKANNGVYTKKGSGEFVQQELGRSFDLIYYDGASRATGANKAWKYVENDDNEQHIMYPGRAYMIYLTADADIIRFERKEGAELHITQVETKKYPVSQGVNPDYADWNGIANPATYHAYLNVGATDGRGQVYNPDTKQYEMFNMSSNKLVVGQPIFVQPKTAKTVVASDTYGTYSPAPHRAKAEESMTRYELYLAPSMDVATDRIIVRMSEDKETDEYIVGQDLAKMGVSSLVPQMWVDRYDSKMCINTAIPTDDQAYYPLGISVPQNGEYDIFLDDEPDSESTLYLTYDGEVIWNLSYGFYVAHLEKGTNTHYGLRIVKTPKVATGIDNAETSGKDINVYKIIVDDKVFIIRGNQVYGIDGRLAK